MSRIASDTGAPPTDAAAIPDRSDAVPAMATLRVRADFLKAASARRHGTAGFLLQARQRPADEPTEAPVRIGFTCSKKLGNAVTRNRAKRRLRAIVREVMPGAARPGWDYVLVGRPESTVTRDFASLRDDLRQALSRIHDAPQGPQGPTPPRGPRRGKGKPAAPAQPMP